MPGIKADRWIKEKCQTHRDAIVNKETRAFVAWADSNLGLMLREHPDVEVETFIQSPMIEPFSDKQVSEVDGRSIIPYGVSSYGYDIRCANEFKIFTNLNTTVVDPKNFTDDNFVTKVVADGEAIVIPPNSFALANTVEHFKIDRGTLVICLGKSTYARCGIIVNVTPLEPEWEGSLTLEFSNTTPLPAKIYAGEGCAQIIFLDGDEECEISYADRKGKYMHQSAVPTAPRMLDKNNE